MHPELRWSRDLETIEAGPLLWLGPDGSPSGAVFGNADSLFALDAERGAVLQSWAWPQELLGLTWEQESYATSAYGLALFGPKLAAILRPDGSVEVHPYPPGGASFRSGSLSVAGELLLSWRRDSSGQGLAANQVLQSHGQDWNVAATAPDDAGLFDAPQAWKRGWFSVLRRGTHCELWWTDRGTLNIVPLVGGDGTGHPASVRGEQLFYASQDSAVSVDLGRGTREWALSLPAGLDVGVHRLHPDRPTWVLLSSRGWWRELNMKDGRSVGAGELEPIWLERWAGTPWIFTRDKSLFYWGNEKPIEVVLAPERMASQAVSARGMALVRMGSKAAGIALP
jgi:hypothetical protein